MFSRSTGPEKLPEIIQIQFCKNHRPRDLGGAMIRKTIFRCIYVGKNFLKN
jgi:hypothetical protein